MVNGHDTFTTFANSRFATNIEAILEFCVNQFNADSKLI